MATTPQMLSSTPVFLINGQGLQIIVHRVVKKLDINNLHRVEKIPLFQETNFEFCSYAQFQWFSKSVQN